MRRKKRFFSLLFAFTGILSFSPITECGCLLAAMASHEPAAVETSAMPCHPEPEMSSVEEGKEGGCCKGCRFERAAFPGTAGIAGAAVLLSHVFHVESFLAVSFLTIVPAGASISSFPADFSFLTPGVCPGQPVFLSTKHLLI